MRAKIKYSSFRCFYILNLFFELRIYTKITKFIITFKSLVIKHYEIF